jgi:hypothetical protein
MVAGAIGVPVVNLVAAVYRDVFAITPLQQMEEMIAVCLMVVMIQGPVIPTLVAEELPPPLRYLHRRLRQLLRPLHLP